MSLIPTEIIAPKGALLFEIHWQDGTESLIKHSVLRGFCPCADCQGHQGPIEWVGDLAGNALQIASITESGNYALNIIWEDGHFAGIYPYSYLKKLGDLYNQSEDEYKKLKIPSF